MNVSPHFNIVEFHSRDGVDTPSHYRAQLPELCRLYLEPLRRRFGPVHVVSGFRSDRHNSQVGGARSSFHLNRPGRRGVAADVICRSGVPADWHHFLSGLNPGGLGRYPGFVHVDTREARSRW